MRGIIQRPLALEGTMADIVVACVFDSVLALR